MASVLAHHGNDAFNHFGEIENITERGNGKTLIDSRALCGQHFLGLTERPIIGDPRLNLAITLPFGRDAVFWIGTGAPAGFPLGNTERALKRISLSIGR